MAALKVFSAFFVCALFASSSAFKLGEADNCRIDDYSSVESVTQNCTTIIVGNVSVPAGKTLKLDLKSGTNLTFTGIITFGYKPWNGPLVWITGNNLNVDGSEGHRFEGHGEIWWDGLGDNSFVLKPLLVLIQANNSRFTSIFIKDCPHRCVNISDSDNLSFQNWVIDIFGGDEKGAANTDGFIIIKSQNIFIQDCRITNQNDCICVYQGQHMLFENIDCIGGHGLSVAAGFWLEYDLNTIYNVTFKDCHLSKNRNGIHVKTVPGDQKGLVSGVTYQNIQLDDITLYAINVEQDYYRGGPTGAPRGNVLIKDLVISDIHGNLNGTESIKAFILCGRDGCDDWHWSGIDVSGAQKRNVCNFNPFGFRC